MKSDATTSSAPPAKRLLSLRSLVTQAYIWLALPLLIWIFGWLRWYCAVPLAAILILAVGRILKGEGDGSGFVSEHFSPVTMDRKFWMIALVVLLYVIYCGMGGFFYQIPADNFYRNAIFYDLVRRPWPVEYPPLADGEPRMLCYYLGFWLPAALGAKLCGGYIMPGDALQVIYAAWGLFIALCFISSYCGGRMRWILLIVFLFFGGWDIVTSLIFAPADERDTLNKFLTVGLDQDASTYYDIANTSIFTAYIYNQGIPSLVGCLLILFQRRRPELLLLPFALLFFFAPLPCVGVAVVMVPWMLRNWRKSLSWLNAAALPLLAVTALYFMANNNANRPLNHLADGLWPEILGHGLAWLTLGVGIWLPFIWKSVRRNWMFWTWVAVGYLAPLYGMGQDVDFGLRVSIPLSIYMMLLVADAAASIRRWNSARGWALGCTLAIGSCAPLGVYYYVVYHAVTKCIMQGVPAKRIHGYNLLSDPDHNVFYNNFIATGQGPFYRYLMRHGDEAQPEQH